MPKQPPSYSKDQVDGFLGTLDQIPPPEEKDKQYSTQEAVKLMAKKVRALEKQGHSIERIGKALREAGFSITDSTLRNYLKSGRPKKKKATKATKATSATSSTA